MYTYTINTQYKQVVLFVLLYYYKYLDIDVEQANRFIHQNKCRNIRSCSLKWMLR